MTHSLGGLILKQAICIANEQLHNNLSHEYFLNSLAGLIFFSTPHFGSHQDTEVVEHVSNIFRSSRAGSAIPASRISNEASANLKGLSLRFEDVRIQTDILSIYETTKTEVKGGFLKHKSKLIVGRDLCRIGASKERFIGLRLDHQQICCFETDEEDDTGDEDDPRTKLRQFVREVLSDAPDVIAERLQAGISLFPNVNYADTSPSQLQIRSDNQLFSNPE